MKKLTLQLGMKISKMHWEIIIHKAYFEGFVPIVLLVEVIAKFPLNPEFA